MYYDTEIFRVMNGLVNQSKTIDMVVIFFADYLPYLMVLFLVSFLFWPRSGIPVTQETLANLKKDKIKNGMMVLVAVLSAIIARFLVKNIILIFYHRPRPYITLSAVNKLIFVSTSESFQSFPSGHAIFFFAMASAVYLYNKKWGIVFFIVAILMGISRIIAGVHYPSDVLGGAIIGIIVAYIVFYFLERYIGNKMKRYYN